MVSLVNHDPDNRFTIAVGRKSVELARATVRAIAVGKISSLRTASVDSPVGFSMTALISSRLTC
jgi:uncharacterized membrane protein